MEKREYRATAQAHARLKQIVDSWPTRTRSGRKTIDALGEIVDFTEDEIKAMAVRNVRDERGVTISQQFNGAVEIHRIIDVAEQVALRGMVDADPLPEDVPGWNRLTYPVQDALIEALDAKHVIEVEGECDE